MYFHLTFMKISFRKQVLVKLKRGIQIIFDLFRGKDYVKTVSSKALGLDETKYNRYSTSDNFYLKKVLDSIKIKEKDNVIDIGSGKGSVLKFLLKYPFKKVAGLEISSELIEISKRNLKEENQERVLYYNCDAKDFMDFDNFNIYYCYNPCSEEIFKQIIDNIIKTAKSNKKFIYNNPKCEKVLLDNNFKELEKFESQWGHGIKLYAFKPQK